MELGKGPSTFYGVFDGHGGKHVADFACSNLLRFILENDDFPREIEKVIASAFLQTDTAMLRPAFWTLLLLLVQLHWLRLLSEGHWWWQMLGTVGLYSAIEAKPSRCPWTTSQSVLVRERKRIEASGAYVNEQFNVARTPGDWHMGGLKDRDGGSGPLNAEPEVMQTRLTEEDESLIIGCDGIWDVFRSQNAVDSARRKLQEHNDPAICCKELVDEAQKRKSSDNVSVVVVCLNSKPPPAITTPRPQVPEEHVGLRVSSSFRSSWIA